MPVFGMSFPSLPKSIAQGFTTLRTREFGRSGTSCITNKPADPGEGTQISLKKEGSISFPIRL